MSGPADNNQGSKPGRAIARADTEPGGKSPMPFQDLHAPSPIETAPPTGARWLAFGGVLVGGLLGGLIGYGIGDILGGSSTMAALGALVGGIGCAIGVGIVASLTLRAMNEWKVSIHPEDPRLSQ